MKYRALGQTDIRVSTVAMGCWALGGGRVWGAQDEADSVATVQAALDTGVNFFDTAEGYGGGESEAVLGRALLGRRHEAVIATKVSRPHLAYDDVLRACEGSLRRLQTDVIDLYQVHWPDPAVPLAETMEALDRLLEQGKVRAVGVCNFGVGNLSHLSPSVRVETNQLPYSLLWRAIEVEIQQACVDQGLGILCYSPLAQGLLTGKYASADDVPAGRARTRLFSGERPQANHGETGCEREAFLAIDAIRRVCNEIGASMANVALAWLLQQAGVTSVLAGARRAEQILQTAEAAELALSPETVAALSDATATVKREMGSNPDMWLSQSRFR